MATIDVWLDELTGATIIITAIISTTDRGAADRGEYRQAAGAIARNREAARAFAEAVIRSLESGDGVATQRAPRLGRTDQMQFST